MPQINMRAEIGKAMSEFLESPEAAIERVQDLYDRVRKVGAKTSEITCLRALRALTSMNKDWAQAIVYANQVLALEGPTAGNLVVLATFQERNGDKKAAIGNYASALKFAKKAGDLEAEQRASDGLARLQTVKKKKSSKTRSRQ